MKPTTKKITVDCIIAGALAITYMLVTGDKSPVVPFFIGVTVALVSTILRK